jgi:hypothetical protein
MARRQKQQSRGAGGSAGSALRQADLSHLRVQDMSPEERAELRRRYDDFVRHFGREGAAPSRYPGPAKPRIRKWTPGKKA